MDAYSKKSFSRPDRAISHTYSCDKIPSSRKKFLSPNKERKSADHPDQEGVTSLYIPTKDVILHGKSRMDGYVTASIDQEYISISSLMNSVGHPIHRFEFTVLSSRTIIFFETIPEKWRRTDSL